MNLKQERQKLGATLGCKVKRGVRAVILGRLIFCSDVCVDAALEGDTSTGRKRMRIAVAVARTIKCYTCDGWLDEEKGA